MCMHMYIRTCACIWPREDLVIELYLPGARGARLGVGRKAQTGHKALDAHGGCVPAINSALLNRAFGTLFCGPPSPLVWRSQELSGHLGGHQIFGGCVLPEGRVGSAIVQIIQSKRFNDGTLVWTLNPNPNTHGLIPS